jgi:two-component system, NarL family, sensor kinase
VARHSRANEVKIQLTWNDEEVSLSICDNGRGFNIAHTVGKGLGLTSMRERVEALQGRLSISSSEEGITVEAHVPVDPVDARIKVEGNHE